MFKTKVDSVTVSNVKGKAAPLRPHRGPPAQLEKGLRAARRGQEIQFRGDGIEEHDSRCH